MEKDGLRLVSDNLMSAIECFLVISQHAARLVHNEAVQLPNRLETIGKSLLRMDDNILLKSGNGLFKAVVMVNDVFRRFGWRLGGQVRHEVGNGLIFLMSDTSDDRDREFCDGFSNEVMIKEEKIGLRTTSPNDDHGVIKLATAKHIEEAINQLLDIRLTLH